ncbi:MAG: DUF4091 domain-containing protein [Granulosicoccus sp.]
MPVIVSRRDRLLRQLLLLLPLLLLLVTGLLHKPTPLFDQSCLHTPDGLVVCAASEMARITRTGKSQLEHPRFDLNSESQDRLTWQVVRNETIALQLIIRRASSKSPEAVSVHVAGSPLQTSIYKAHYHSLDNAGYQWGPATKVLPFPARYPDALIPQQHGCFNNKTPLFNDIALPRPANNQSVWVEIYVPAELDVGEYVQTINLRSAAGEIQLPITLQLLDAALPDKPTIDAVGEVYRAYKLEGAGNNRGSIEWQQMAQCYQQIAHQHRMVFIERTPDAPESEEDWQAYAAAFGPSLTGTLFSADFGYTGTGSNSAVSVWRTPWSQDYDITVENELTGQQILGFTELAGSWAAQVEKHGWTQPRYFAYVFDEVDGPSDESEAAPGRRQYISRVHNAMQQVQLAIDNGAEGIDLLWTSHSDPTIWQHDPDTTLINKVRLWAPNGHAANTEFLSQRMSAGERTWFYHSGHPAVGGHSINLPGADMRSWGVIGARYGIQGQLMWAVNLGSDELPFAQPSYKPDDDRVGNGVLVYPGKQLPKIGYPSVPGPIPSMRLKAWHRGLQDAELFFLAKEQNPGQANALIEQLVPRALGEAVAAGDTIPTWPADAASWIEWRDNLLQLIAAP